MGQSRSSPEACHVRHQTLSHRRGQCLRAVGTTDTIEKSLQTLFEKNLEALLGELGVRFLNLPQALARIDENGCPVILEYGISPISNYGAPVTNR